MIQTAGAISSSTGITASDAFFSGNITSSGNISCSSGAIHGPAYTIAGKRIAYDDPDIKFLDTGLWVNGGHITASNNISASGTITGDLLTINEHKISEGISKDGSISGYQVGSNFVIQASDLKSIRHITASGNISAAQFRGGVRTLDQTVQISPGSNAQGDIFFTENSLTLVHGKIYKLQTNSNITECDHDTLGGSEDALLGVAIGDNSQKHGLLLRGMVKLHTDPCPGGSALGTVVYMYDNGLATGSISGYTSNQFIRIVGHYISGSGTIYFNPDSTWIKKA